jgi:hypothetical protein
MPGETANTAFMQVESVRRWVAEGGYHLVAMCQDGYVPGADGARPGFRALHSIVAAGQAELVVVPSLAALSADKITQEILLLELRKSGAAIASTDDSDLPALAVHSKDPSRVVIRDVLHRSSVYRHRFEQGSHSGSEADPDGQADVVVEFLDRQSFQRIREQRAALTV